MAYEALDSLQQTLIRILKRSYHPDIDREIISIHDEAVFWQLHLKSNPEILEKRIKEKTNAAKETIEYIFSEDNPLFVEWMDAQLLTQLREAAWILMPLSTAPHSVDSKRPRTATTRKDVVVGLEKDLKEIRNRLCINHQSLLQVISIVGKGGTGKTTFAKLVYNDQSITYHFDTCAWVTASQDYSVESMLLDLGRSLKIDEESNIPVEFLFQGHLENKRFLIIIDDLSCNTTWDDLKMLFPETYNGSRILLTTRLDDVAAYAGSSSPVHTMRLLNPRRSWELLRKKAFVDESCPIELEDVGKKIVKSCGGLPFSIELVAGILSSVPKTRHSWKKIAANDDDNVETIISMSYNLLPDYMKACFLYMGGFPEDWEICISELVELWIAEGFLKCKEEAEYCLDDLVERNLVSVNGKRYTCSLHNMVRDFCMRQAQREDSLLVNWVQHSELFLTANLRSSSPLYV